MGMTGEYGDNPWKFLNSEFRIIVLFFNLTEFRFWEEFLIGQLIVEVTFSFDQDLCGEYRLPRVLRRCNTQFRNFETSHKILR